MGCWALLVYSRVLLGATGNWWVWLGTAGICWGSLLRAAGCRWVLLVAAGGCVVLLGVAGGAGSVEAAKGLLGAASEQSLGTAGVCWELLMPSEGCWVCCWELLGDGGG